MRSSTDEGDCPVLLNTSLSHRIDSSNDEATTTTVVVTAVSGSIAPRRRNSWLGVLNDPPLREKKNWMTSLYFHARLIFNMRRKWKLVRHVLNLRSSAQVPPGTDSAELGCWNRWRADRLLGKWKWRSACLRKKSEKSRQHFYLDDQPGVSRWGKLWMVEYLTFFKSAF